MEDIRIIGADKDRSFRTSGEAYGVDFELSDTPTHEWLEIFYDVWSHRTSYREKPSVLVRGDHLVVYLELDDIGDLESVHLPRLKKAIESTNAELREHEAKEREEGDRWARETEEGRKRIAEALDKLSFDD